MYERARKLGLRAGTPQGMVSVKSLADDPKWGYDYYKTLRLLEAGRVRIRGFAHAGLKNRRGVLYVCRHDADLAAAAWEKARADRTKGKERPWDAAKRLHVRAATVWSWLTNAGLVPPKTSQTKRIFWALPEVYDRLAKDRPRGCRKPRQSRVKEGLSEWMARTPRRTPAHLRTPQYLPGASAAQTPSQI